jgi:hypothetical protein
MKSKPNPKDFIFSSKSGETLLKPPGAIRGYDFAIENLQQCVIYLLDRSAQITVDECQGCRFYIGPVEGSIFFRDCIDCTVSVCCQQLRTKNCHRVVFNAMVTSDPTIEYSDELQFGPYNFAYPKLDEHLAQAKLQVEDDHWSQIFDFNREEGSQHWSLQNPANFKAEEYSLEGFDAPVNPVPRHQKYRGTLTGPIPMGSQQQLGVEDDTGMYIAEIDVSQPPGTGLQLDIQAAYHPSAASEDIFGFEPVSGPTAKPDLRATDPFAPPHDHISGFSQAVPAAESNDPFGSRLEPGLYRPVEIEPLDEEEEMDAGVRERLAARERDYQEQMRALYEKDEREKDEKSERRRAAAEELLRWRAERTRQIEQRKLYNRQQEDSFLQARKGFQAGGAQWKKVSSMIDYKESSDRADLGRMRQVLLAKKNEA